MADEWREMSTTELTIGRRLRYLREQREWTQTDVAKKMGVSEMTVWRMERGRELTVTELQYFSKLYKRSLNYLVYGVDREPPFINAADG